MTDRRSMPQIMDSIGQSLANIIGPTRKGSMTIEQAYAKAQEYIDEGNINKHTLALLIMLTYNEGELAGAKDMGETLLGTFGETKKKVSE